MSNTATPHDQPAPSAINKKWLIILNPTAGSGKAKKQWPIIEASLQKHNYSYTIQFTIKKGHATAIAEDFIQKGFRQILAIGGDGTNNEVINGIMNQEVVDSNAISYCLLPIGTGNDWIRTHGITKNVESFVERLKKGKIKYQDIGLAKYKIADQNQHRYFANLAGLAYDAYLVNIIEENRNILSNRWLYFYQLIKGLFKYKLQKATVRFNDQKVEDKFYSINVGICNYAGGGMKIAPHAVPDDGQLALTLIKDISKIGIVLNSFRLYNGSIGQHKRVSLHQTQTLRIDSNDPNPLLVEVDGELIATAPVEFSIIPGALKLLIP